MPLVMLFQGQGAKGRALVAIPIPAKPITAGWWHVTSPGVTNAEREPYRVSPPWRGEGLPLPSPRRLVLNGEDVKLRVDSPVLARLQQRAGRRRAINPSDIPFEYRHISVLLSRWAVVYGFRAERKSCAEPAQ